MIDLYSLGENSELKIEINDSTGEMLIKQRFFLEQNPDWHPNSPIDCSGVAGDFDETITTHTTATTDSLLGNIFIKIEDFMTHKWLEAKEKISTLKSSLTKIEDENERENINEKIEYLTEKMNFYNQFSDEDEEFDTDCSGVVADILNQWKDILTK